jgi:tripartite-type tricarboxylate transporter receptor subunit TctC
MKPWSSSVLLAACLAFAAPATTLAQGFPAKPLRLIVPFPAGGGSDIVGRIVAQELSERLGQQVVVDNRAGAGGSIGTGVAVRADADGYTMVLASTSEIAVNPAIYPKLDYDPVKDLAPVGVVGTTPMVVIVPASSQAGTLAELVTLSRDRPGALNMASAGNGSFTHLAGELFRSTHALNWVHVPYKGTAPAVNDVAAGQMQVMFATLPGASALIGAGKVRPLAVSSAARAAAIPSVPTVRESGFAYEVEYWYGLFVPSATPPAVVARLSAALGESLKAPRLVESLAKQGVTPGSAGTTEFRDYVRAEFAKWGKVVRDSGAKVD